MLAFGMPITFCAAAGSVGGRTSWRCSPLGTSKYTRSVQPYFGALATSRSCLVPSGLVQVGSVSASHENPPP